jgi:sialic acid synthase SpsE/mannose-6-phosphate isomerase-like protein (cupin superfamily)
MGSIPENLFILEMANNHMGDLKHGINVIKSFAEVCRKFKNFNFAFKLQYRDLDSFIHPLMKGRDDIKYIKRFSETKLSRSDFDILVNEMRNNNFLVLATPFDEKSVNVIEDQDLDFIKIASCSFTDWPLLERVVLNRKPIIASSAGATIDQLDKVISYLQHREKEFVIMHCVGEYPTPNENFHLGQIEFLKKRYPDVRIGFSTHEDPDNMDIIKIAIAKGATVFEKHVGVVTDKYKLNAYSSSPEQFENWLTSAELAYKLCGISSERLPVNSSELMSLQSLQRGVFANRLINPGETITNKDVYFAFPPDPKQINANDWSKYAIFTAKYKIKLNEAISPDNISLVNTSARVWEIAQEVKKLINECKITIPGGANLEISHHYGIEKFNENGLTMITIVNREYCKKLLISLPGQRHPEQYHKIKGETFYVIYGQVKMILDDIESILNPGDVLTIQPGVRHAFSTDTGSIMEEISSTHFLNDSFYTDEKISQNQNRKTFLTYWMK